MALYDYECWKCEIVFEVEHPITETPDVKCPQCETHDFVARIISRSNFVLKGNGWGRDGYRK